MSEIVPLVHNRVVKANSCVANILMAFLYLSRLQSSPCQLKDSANDCLWLEQLADNQTHLRVSSS